jgi:hypothetical protein
MPPERLRKLAGEGGKLAHAQGKAHEFTPEEARRAGVKGGQAVSANREHMREIGRLGGLRKRKPAAAASTEDGDASTRESEGLAAGPMHAGARREPEPGRSDNADTNLHSGDAIVEQDDSA